MSKTKWLRDVFTDVQTDLEHNLQRASRGIEHPGTKGDVHEDSWIELLRSYLPKRYEIDKGIIIDNQGNKSHQIDVVIYDPQYTPLLLTQQNHKYIPVEAVYAVFECKPEINKNYLQYAGEKTASVRSLKRTSIGIKHAGGIYPPKELFRIIGGILAAKSCWTDGLKSSSFESNLPTIDLQKLDCGCALACGAFNYTNDVIEVVKHEANLMHFLFNLLDSLQSLGTVPAIDWKAYSKVL